MACSLLTYRLFNYAFVSHFNLTERLGVLGKAGIKEAIIRNSFRYFQACQSSYADPEYLHHHLDKYLASVDQHRHPEAWAAEVSKTLQIFPIVDIGVSTLDDRKCIVLREPDVLDSDAVLGVPGIASESYKDFVLKL
ncbi:hypothetical protein IscW_ISCW021902 [Ixodes scapularis]|uniref:Uncharacterized protein n=1 Tax=Ixodes scapularis TaxID=6945 RepID=B7QFJ0_IXOSC|nr:hypothetical protein IscW_ISCW021902 [Ixodes scapularis]|eukprot:XP_002414304.1 hypothetical protein IscW_ISCW021902 [Ixodes scapularis]